MADKKYDLIHREALFQGYYRVDRFHIRQQFDDGTWSDVFSREVFDGNKDVVVLLLFDPQQDKVVMIEQFRPGPMSKGDDPFMTECVAGVIDLGETPEITARREAREESGCEVTDLQKVFSYYTSPGCLGEHVTAFVGRTKAPEEGGICGLAEEGEHIHVLVMDAMKAISLLYEGKLRDAGSIIAMQWFALHHTELRSRWLVGEASGAII
ncbi:MAG: NUDIX domain-containing protein [Alphaproteobacteria bacterium]|nr:NUDIX domain-containing protein [Alphaproteobacteria bacterium]